MQSIKTQQIQNVTPQYQQQDATISSAVPTNGATDTTAGLNIKVNKKKRPSNNLKSKFNKKQGIPSTIQPYKKIKNKLLNIHGLTKVKAVELEHLFENNDILCLTETQQKIGKISFSRSLKYITSMQDVKGKKGGGLMILCKNTNFLIKKIETIHKDILVIQCQIYSLELRMIFSLHVGYNYDGNNQLIQYVQEHIENTKNYIILGDFNGHTGFLGPQSMNKWRYDVRAH